MTEIKTDLTRMECESRPFKIMKRSNEYENEVIKPNTNVNVLANNYGDRFIPRRYVSKNSKIPGQSFYKRTKSSEIDLFDMKNISGFWRLHGMRIRFESCFHVNNPRVLEFHDRTTFSVCPQFQNKLPPYNTVTEGYIHDMKLDWPCKPRLKPAAFAHSSHDLPGINLFSHLQIISWSKSGKVAASFGADLVLWVPSTETTIVYRIEGITALAYNATGLLLAVGVQKLNSTILQIWSEIHEKGMNNVNFHLYKRKDNDAIRCIAWDPKNKYILCGMVHGDINVHRMPDLKLIRTLEVHTVCVSKLQFSSNRTYFASSDTTGHVMVWFWKTLTRCIQWEDTNQCLIAWHPWKETDLIIATTIPATICLINLTSKKVVSYYRRTDSKCRIDAITFNKLSGELVVSCCLFENDNRTNEILVMASMNRVVDTMSTHEKSVRFLMWNPDSTQLGITKYII